MPQMIASRILVCQCRIRWLPSSIHLSSAGCSSSALEHVVRGSLRRGMKSRSSLYIDMPQWKLLLQNLDKGSHVQCLSVHIVCEVHTGKVACIGWLMRMLIGTAVLKSVFSLLSVITVMFSALAWNSSTVMSKYCAGSCCVKAVSFGTRWQTSRCKTFSMQCAGLVQLWRCQTVPEERKLEVGGRTNRNLRHMVGVAIRLQRHGQVCHQHQELIGALQGNACILRH